MIFLVSEALVYFLIIIPIVFIILLIIVAIVKKLKKYNKLTNIRSDEIDVFQQHQFFEAYGGENNIISVTQEMSRITVEVEDAEKVDLNRLKELGALSVLVMGNKIKASFSDRAKYVYKLLK